MDQAHHEERRLFRWKLWFTLVSVAVAGFAYLLRDLILLTFLSFLVAIFWDEFATPLQRLSKERIPRWLAVILAMALTFAILSLFVFFMFQPLNDQFNSFLTEWPRMRQDLWMRLQPILRRLGLGTLSPAKLQGESVQGGLIPMGLAVVGIGVHTAAWLLAVIFLAFFWAYQPQYYREGFLRLLPAPAAAWADVILRSVVSSMRQWLKATGLAMVSVGVMTTLLLWVIGVPYALLFGAAAGVFDLVPFLGPVLAFAGPTIITLTMAPDKIIWLLGGYLLVQTIEGNVIQPWVMSREVELPPALTIFTIFAMNTLFGVLGIFLAAPTLAIILSVLRVRAQNGAQRSL